jgi:hypothetical protein
MQKEGERERERRTEHKEEQKLTQMRAFCLSKRITKTLYRNFFKS